VKGKPASKSGGRRCNEPRLPFAWRMPTQQNETKQKKTNQKEKKYRDAQDSAETTGERRFPTDRPTVCLMQLSKLVL